MAILCISKIILSLTSRSRIWPRRSHLRVWPLNFLSFYLCHSSHLLITHSPIPRLSCPFDVLFRSSNPKHPTELTVLLGHLVHLILLSYFVTLTFCSFLSNLTFLPACWEQRSSRKSVFGGVTHNSVYYLVCRISIQHCLVIFKI